jgi:hypothetical protein
MIIHALATERRMGQCWLPTLKFQLDAGVAGVVKQRLSNGQVFLQAMVWYSLIEFENKRNWPIIIAFATGKKT